MTSLEARRNQPMRTALRQIGLITAVLVALCLICRLVFYRTYTADLPVDSVSGERSPGEEFTYKADEPDIISSGEWILQDGRVHLRLQPGRGGMTDLSIYRKNGELVSRHELHVDSFLTTFDRATGSFTGDKIIMIAVTLFWFLVSLVMIRQFRLARGPSFYAYSTIYFSGFSVFSLANGVIMLIVTVRHLADPADFSMLSVYSAINSASLQFMILSTPLVVLFAIATAVSNIELLRHERFRFQNVLGILLSVLLLVGEAIGWAMFSADFAGSEWELRLRNTLYNVYATVFVYFECMLIGSVTCAILAARRLPTGEKDYIIILGCRFRSDGSLTPLLRGRVDRALDFWRKQRASTGLSARLIPSGGQGPDECMAEAEAMTRYLKKKSFPEELILQEDRSRNTLENMRLSREIIEREGGDKRVVFATTNYHVFRSGLWAARAGLEAEGIGSRTKWWFWPNAFLRECAGLMQYRWKQELIFLIVLMIFFGMLSAVIGY